MLVWGARASSAIAQEEPAPPVLVELPRLKAELRPRTDESGVTRLYLREAGLRKQRGQGRF